MNCNTANKLSIVDILENFNIHPRIHRGNRVSFLSPFRKEQTPSFLVCTKKNVWYDHGENIGGKVIDLITRFYNCSISEGLALLSQKSFSFHQQPFPINNLEPTFNIQKICEIQKPGLISYLNYRKINVAIAKRYCQEIHHSYKSTDKHSHFHITLQNDNDIKSYYAIALSNDKKGYEIRNKYFKGCVGSKAVSTIINSSNTVNTFESFSDFLSYLTISPDTQSQDFIITNSTALIEKTLPKFSSYQNVNSFFDNDNSGIKATQILKDFCKNNFKDCSTDYKNYKDLNEFLMNRERFNKPD
ncbi:MAG: toprim domain-containing protein [Nonlabens sp.]|uniref:toprim domain-containing protein n=1 Tax=Nonlabens sp. TaxID=1888209 RepID=UPI003EF492BC